MPLPYALMTLLYAALAALVAVDAAAAALGLVPFFSGLRWLRVHPITLGIGAQLAFGVMPGLVAARAGLPRPTVRWDVWLCLNVGLLLLLIGVPLVQPTPIAAGGLLVMLSVALQAPALIRHAVPDAAATAGSAPGLTGRRFYLAALAFLLVGATLGTGLWLGWTAILAVAAPIEAHIHANAFGFVALLFAGLLVDLHADIIGQPLAWPRSVPVIFWLMTLGAMGLVLGPWLNAMFLTMPGVLLQQVATIWLLLNVVKPLVASGRLRQPGPLHLVTAYAWFLAPIFVAPLVMTGAIEGTAIEQSAPQALMYGWVLQFCRAAVPFLLRRWLLPAEPTTLGGGWASLVLVHAGAATLWASMFALGVQAPLVAVAYLLWAVALAGFAREVAGIVGRASSGAAA
ncbi:MAG: hypothetical protein U0821_04335 [Chloroflexota bacterium]